MVRNGALVIATSSATVPGSPGAGASVSRGVTVTD